MLQLETIAVTPEYDPAASYQGLDVDGVFTQTVCRFQLFLNHSQALVATLD